MKTTFALIIILLSVFGLYAQSEKKKRRLILNEANINQGSYFFTSSRRNIELKEYFQNSPDALNVIKNNYMLSRDNYYIDPSVQTNIQMGFRFRKSNSDEINDRLSLRIGLLYHHSYVNYSDFFQGNNFNTSTTPVFIDSQTFGIKETSGYRNVTASGSGESVLLHSAIQFYTKPTNHIQFYAGIGIGVGLAFNQAFLLVEQNYFSSQTTLYNIEVSTPISKINEILTDVDNRYISKLNNTFTTQLYFPLGIRLRLGTVNKFWKKIYVGNELWTTFSIDHSKKFGLFTRFGMLSNFSLSYQFGQ